MGDKLDILPNDKCKFRENISAEDLVKISKFNKKNYSSDSAYYVDEYIRINNCDKAEIIIEQSNLETEKTKTNFCIIIIRIPNHLGKVRIAIQSRYLEVVDRKHNHPLTSIFSNWWRKKN